MFDLDEGFHALQNLDAQGRKALVLAGKLWEEIYRDENQHVPASHIVSRYLTELAERSEQVRVLRKRLDDVLDSREQTEIRAEQAEALLEKERRQHYLHHREPRTPPPWDDERIDRLHAESQLLRRELKTAREAQFVAIEKMKQERARMTKALEAEHRAFRIAEHERDRAVAAEQKADELRDEVSRLRSHLDF